MHVVPDRVRRMPKSRKPLCLLELLDSYGPEVSTDSSKICKRLIGRMWRRSLSLCASYRTSSALAFSSCNVDTVSAAQAHMVQNLVEGKWQRTAKAIEVMDPLNGERFMSIPDTSSREISPFVQSLWACPNSMHNPFKNIERYQLYARVRCKAAALLQEPQVRSLNSSFIFPTSHSRRWPYGPVAIIGAANYPLQMPALHVAGALCMGNKPILSVDCKVSVVVEQFIRLFHM